jgi:cell shape-determining protein MreD
MRWGGFWLALLMVVAAQTLLWYLGFRVFNLYLVLAILCGLHAATPDARLGAWAAGLTQDALSLSPMGLHALVLGLTGLLLTWLRDTGFAWVGGLRTLAALLAALPGQILYFSWLHFAPENGTHSVLRVIGDSLLECTLAALLAAVITHLPWFVPKRPYRRSRGF